MLSQNEMVCISRDRVAGARFIAANLAVDVIIMDDGMQNPWLKKDMILAVFDGTAGLGNGRILPSGPLRQTLAAAQPVIDMAVINGEDKTNLRTTLAQNIPCLTARLLPNPETAEQIKGRRCSWICWHWPATTVFRYACQLRGGSGQGAALCRSPSL